MPIRLFRGYRRFLREQLMHDDHQYQDQKQVHRKERDIDVIGDQPEQRGHGAGADIGARHLHSDCPHRSAQGSNGSRTGRSARIRAR